MPDRSHFEDLSKSTVVESLGVHECAVVGASGDSPIEN
uniref:Uncharacterized protein n=1 Tax=Pseudomonas aeruginosa TaxID=287 RepID=A0A7S5YEA1_PSEAI|nr:hypothetical protein [Pseudomonas aeruginosa]UGK56039.1 Hypothetical protein [Pseudomonas aeruginosa]